MSPDDLIATGLQFYLTIPNNNYCIIKVSDLEDSAALMET